MITIFKYIPRVYIITKHRSTEGWSRLTVILDLIGGVFSIIQLLLDAVINNEWEGISGVIGI